MSVSENPFETAQRWETQLDGERFLPKGNHVVQVTEATDGTSPGGFPQVELRFANNHGRQKKNLVYGSSAGPMLGKVTQLYDAAGQQVPQHGEFDPDDQLRIKQAALDRLVGSWIGIVVVEEQGFNDPTKTFNVVDGFVDKSRITGQLDRSGVPEVDPSADFESVPAGGFDPELGF